MFSSSPSSFRVHFDRAGTLWVGTARGGAVRYQNGRFVAVRAIDSPITGVVSFRETPDGVVWINSNGFFATLDRQHLTVARAVRFEKLGFEHLLLEDRDGAQWFRMQKGVRPGFTCTLASIL